MKKIYKLFAVLSLSALGFSESKAQSCIFTTQYPSTSTIAINGVPGFTTNVTTCNFGGEYSVNNFTTAGTYSATSSVGTDFLTVTNNANVVIIAGLSPLSFTIPSVGLYRIHVATSSTCGTQSSCRNINVIKPPTPCTVVPSATATANSILPCPGTTLSLNSNAIYVGSGFTYQWHSSTVSIAGPFTSVGGATNTAFSTTVLPVTNTWYQLVATCANGPLTGTSAPIQVGAAVTTTNTVPYFEGFETLTAGNLPNCSWSRTGDWTTATTTLNFNRAPKSGVGYAYTFWSTIAGGDMLYSNGIQLNAGVTYSGAVSYNTDGTSGFTELSMLVGPNQSTLAAVSIASVAAITNSVYATITNTFNVPTSGIYFLGFRAVAPTSNPWYLMVDDISVTAPCSLNAPVLSVSGNSAICSGSSTSLTASGASSYVWSSGPSTPSISVSPSVTTTYTVTGTNALSCTNTAVQVVSVTPLPTIIISGTNSICAGSSTTLTAGGATSYSWSNGPATATNAVSPVATTSYTVMGTTNGCTGMAMQTVSVNAIPTVSIAGTAAICAGSSTTLTASGATSYSWSNGPATAANAVSPAATTSYTVMGTSNGCTGMAMQTVSVNAAPSLSIAGTAAICAGSSTTLTASGATSYSWSNGPATAANAVSPAATTSYTVMGTANGCTGMAMQTVSVNALPSVSLTASSTTVCINTSTITLAGTPAGGTYTGTNVAGNVFTPGAIAGTFNPTYAFTNTVTGCSNTATASIIVSGCVGLAANAVNATEFTAYPNPTNGVFTLTFANGLEKTVTVTDVTGKVVFTTVSKQTQLEINLNELTNGIYTVKVQGNQSVNVLKVVKN